MEGSPWPVAGAAPNVPPAEKTADNSTRYAPPLTLSATAHRPGLDLKEEDSVVVGVRRAVRSAWNLDAVVLETHLPPAPDGWTPPGHDLTGLRLGSHLGCAGGPSTSGGHRST